MSPRGLRKRTLTPKLIQALADGTAEVKLKVRPPAQTSMNMTFRSHKGPSDTCAAPRQTAPDASRCPPTRAAAKTRERTKREPAGEFVQAVRGEEILFEEAINAQCPYHAALCAYESSSGLLIELKDWRGFTNWVAAMSDVQGRMC